VSAPAERLVELLPAAGVDALLVTNLVNVRYLTGFTGSNAIAVVGAGVRAFVTDFRYVERAAEEVDPSFERRRSALHLHEALEDVVPGAELRLGFEEDHVSVRMHAQLRERLPARIELIGVNGLVEGLRAVKQPDELAAIKAAAALADEAFEQLTSDGLVGRARPRDGARVRDAPARRGEAELRADRGRGAQRRAAPRHAARRRGAQRRSGRDRLGGAARRVLLG
jgi:Xaa-Pro aminopeptidase